MVKCGVLFEVRTIFGSKTDEVTGGWRELPSEELCSLYRSLDIITVIKSRIMRWAGHVARIRKVINAHLRLESVKRRDHSEDLGIDRR
jgi:hypothetical protein